MSELGVAIRPKAGVLCVYADGQSLDRPRSRSRVVARSALLPCTLASALGFASDAPIRAPVGMYAKLSSSNSSLEAVHDSSLFAATGYVRRQRQRGLGKTVAGLTTAGCARSTPAATLAAAALLPSLGGCAPAAAPHPRPCISLRQRTITLVSAGRAAGRGKTGGPS